MQGKGERDCWRLKGGGLHVYLDCRKTPLLSDGASPEFIFAQESFS